MTSSHPKGQWLAALIRCRHCSYKFAGACLASTKTTVCPSCNKETAIRPVRRHGGHT